FINSLTGFKSVNLIGTVNQFISIINDTKEAYYKMGINKTTGIATANTDIWIDQLITGSTANMLMLSNGMFDLNSHALTIWNPNLQSVLRTGGGIISEKTDNSSRITWKMNSNTGSYVFPFIRNDGIYIPFTFSHNSGNAGDVTLATYGTPPNNLPWPTTPDLVTNLASSIGLAPDNRDATVDRFWQIIVSGSANADLTFTYAASELPVAPYNNPNSLQGQRYTISSNQWLPYLPGQFAGSYFVTVPNVSTFSPWTLTNIISPLPIELLSFNAITKGKNVEVTWKTAAEINNNYFTVMRSKDGLNFEEIGQVDGAGNSTIALNYHFTDTKPYNGISFYQLKQTDFNGKTSYSKIVSVRFASQSSFSIEYLLNNPTTHTVNALIYVDNAYSAYTEITDVSGRKIYSKNFIVKNKLVSFSFSSTELSKGIYFLKVTDGIHVLVRKIIM
ncbi:MAG: T9SS type A sorting domain-containing protein, partial [Bacteroidota bacterium]